MKQSYGFIKPQYKEEDYRFGDGQLQAEIVREDGQWDSFLPEFEPQSKNGFDSMNCWNFGTQNCLETLLKTKYGVIQNGSERYICVLGGGGPNGGMPANASEAIRKNGIIPESMLPFASSINSWSEYCSPKPMAQNYLNEGKKWLEQYVYGYDYVKTSYGNWVWRKAMEFVSKKKFGAGWQQEVIKNALKFSPLGVSVCAWKYRNNLAYKNTYDRDNHWLMLYGYEDGKYWKLYDHYSKMHVQAEWLYPFGFIMRYVVYQNNNNTTMAKTLKKKTSPEIYVVSEANPTELTWCGGWQSYKTGLDNGWLLPYEEVETLDGYTVAEGVWGIIK